MNILIGVAIYILVMVVIVRFVGVSVTWTAVAFDGPALLTTMV